jgi:hypothetical protein
MSQENLRTIGAAAPRMGTEAVLAASDAATAEDDLSLQQPCLLLGTGLGMG